MTVVSVSSPARPQVNTRRRIRLRPSAELSRMIRYRGGTYSHTVERIFFADGTSALTDLIRLNPNVPAYSLDFAGISPDHPLRYRLAAWSALPHLHAGAGDAFDAFDEFKVDWILRHSYPMRTTIELSRQVREAGYPLGTANITEPEAIAGTQAAIWQLTNRLALDTRPLHVPVAVQRAPGPVITFEFDGEPQLGGYSARVASHTPVTLTLQKSVNGRVWHDVSGSRCTVMPGEVSCQRTLGLGSTLSASSFGRGGRGYRYYRLIATSPGGTPTISHVRFWLAGARHYRNADRVVHLYNYLLSGARQAASSTPELGLVDTAATADAELIGPFQVRSPLTLKAPDGHVLVDADGFAIGSVVEPGTDFYVRRPADDSPATCAATLTATVPGGRVLTGVALGENGRRFTPIALAVPADAAVEFDIGWDAAPTDLLPRLDSNQEPIG